MNSIKKVLVTGGSGKAGRFVVRELLAHGYDVVNVDWKPSDEVHTFQVELCDLGQVFGVMEGRDAVLHLAAYPWAGEHAAEVVFRNNVMSTYNVLQAACVLGVKKIVLAGSESALGFPFFFIPFAPHYLPIDEAHPLLAQDAYGLSKIIYETLGQGYTRRDPSLSITCLRLSYVLRPEDYREELRQAWADEGRNSFNLWAYIDARDCAAAFRLAMETFHPGFEACYIAARDTLMRQPTLDLVRRYFPPVERVAEGFGGRMSPLDCRRAKQLIGFEPAYTWDMVVSPQDVEG
ncbi:MAG: NAD(P)-dependent oxidoreductase [Anaerolineae bacterium]|nr:NAD(P)-dependent oxidoreductase [Anaerolineae bacterium]